VREKLVAELKPDSFASGVNDGLAAGQTSHTPTSRSSHAWRGMPPIRGAASAGSSRRRTGERNADAVGSKCLQCAPDSCRVLAVKSHPADDTSHRGGAGPFPEEVTVAVPAARCVVLAL
jgi:hypothetical protein